MKKVVVWCVMNMGVPYRGVSTTKSTQVGNVLAKDSVTMAPLADHVKISICPGVSTMT